MRLVWIYFASKTRAKMPAANGAEAKEKRGREILLADNIFSNKTNLMFLYDRQYMNHEDQL